MTAVAVISHHCSGCGSDLTRVRARIDAALGLPIVQCECGRAAVRHSSRRLTPRGRSLRFIRSLLHLAVRVALMGLGTLALVGASAVMSMIIRRLEVGTTIFGNELLIVGAVILLLSMLGGLVYGWVLSHRSPVVGIVALMTLPPLLLTFPFVMELADGGDPEVAIRGLKDNVLTAMVMPLTCWMIAGVGVMMVFAVFAPRAQRLRSQRWRRRLARRRTQGIR